MKSEIDNKIKQLRSITSNFLFIEYYSHKESDCWKIMNEFTRYNNDKIVLCKLDEGIEKAIDLAISHISDRKQTFELWIEALFLTTKTMTETHAERWLRLNDQLKQAKDNNILEYIKFNYPHLIK